MANPIPRSRGRRSRATRHLQKGEVRSVHEVEAEKFGYNKGPQVSRAVMALMIFLVVGPVFVEIMSKIMDLSSGIEQTGEDADLQNEN